MDEGTVQFNEIWTSGRQRVALAGLARGTNALPGEVMEIGTWQGLSAFPIAEAIYPQMLHVVDHWKGSLDIPQELSRRDNYGIFLENMKHLSRGNITIHKMDWRDMAATWESPLRFLYLDAEHTTEEVDAQISWAMPFMTGILAGDDWGWGSVQQAVHQHFGPEKIRTLFNKLWWVEV